uniref:EF-hand domain-containing protein n=1 Tax=Chlamydomonas leiostraca TaxID=1034604 RepID=A0A7S0S858_9CHLO
MPEIVKSNLYSREYAEELFEAADTDGDKEKLTKSEFQHALQLHSMLESQAERQPPSASALRMIFVASAIPFIAFGFLDNAIMLVAGEEIDHVFGARLGLTTLASAGLGNLVADVMGVSVANGIEQGVKKVIKTPKLSRYQNTLHVIKMTRLVGSAVGVGFGCLLGLSPLVLTGTFFVPGS